MRFRWMKYLNPAADIVEHSTVIAIGVEFVTHHWMNLIVSGPIICYIIIYICVRVYPAKGDT